MGMKRKPTKRLKRATIIRELQKVGFEVLSEYGLGVISNQNVASRVFLQFPKDGMSNIVLNDARWIDRPNVHIVSYYAWPSTMEDLRGMVIGIITTYSKLCSTKFSGASEWLHKLM